MLVLTRRLREEIHLILNGEVLARIVLVSTHSDGKARIGIDAPPDVKIIRKEIKDKPPKSQNQVPIIR